MKVSSLLASVTVFTLSTAFSSTVVAEPILKSFDSTPNPSTINIPSGGFTVGQTFTINSEWENAWDKPVKVNFSMNLIENDPLFNDIFPFDFVFTLEANATEILVLSPTLSAGNLNEANEGFGLENGELEFSAEAGTFTFEHVPEPLTILGSATALGFGALLKRESSKKKNKS